MPPIVGKRKFAYTKAGKKKASAYAKKTGRKVRRK
jgi:hypothetical protein|tara:strand:+ start:197 stop:301 length:105 start_codon:yes stop_codon:yes gene_type:complete